MDSITNTHRFDWPRALGIKRKFLNIPAQEESDVKCDLVPETTSSLLKGVKNIAEANSRTPSPSYDFKVVLKKRPCKTFQMMYENRFDD